MHWNIMGNQSLFYKVTWKMYIFTFGVKLFFNWVKKSIQASFLQEWFSVNAFRKNGFQFWIIEKCIENFDNSYQRVLPVSWPVILGFYVSFKLLQIPRDNCTWKWFCYLSISTFFWCPDNCLQGKLALD